MFKKMTEQNRDICFELMQEFYHSDAVHEVIDPTYHQNTLDELFKRDIYLEGYLIEKENQIAGYALLSKSFSPEAGGPIVWIEELYIRKAFQHQGLGKAFFNFLETQYPYTARYRLEVVEENQYAIALYQKRGFKVLPYMQMIKDQ